MDAFKCFCIQGKKTIVNESCTFIVSMYYLSPENVEVKTSKMLIHYLSSEFNYQSARFAK